MIKLRAFSEYDKLPYYIRNGENISYLFLFFGLGLSATPAKKYVLIPTFIVSAVYLIFVTWIKKFGLSIEIETNGNYIFIKSFGGEKVRCNLTEFKLDVLYSEKLKDHEYCLKNKSELFFISSSLFNTIKKKRKLYEFFKSKNLIEIKK